jgi:asparagine synthase (glutamine-hydrolysing)
MCGICGIWEYDNLQSIHNMVAAMHHRGPDDRGIYRDSKVALGMTRLAIIDLSDGGHQPMQNTDQTISIVYNGEVYNFQNERKVLEAKGYSFSSSSDTEIVLRMYEHYRDDFLLRLRGMFALAIYDKRGGPGRERLLLARDHFGIKPLLFAEVGHRLVFASELKALLASGLIEPQIDPVALRLLLTFGSVYQPRTILQGVKMLLPAHRLIIEQGQQRIERYWSLGIDRHLDLRRKPYEELVSEIATVLEESVRLQLVSDVPLGAFLSGGIDSSLLVAMIAQAVGPKIRTFSVGFESEGSDIDESSLAERTARYLGTNHTNVLVRGSEVRDRIQHIARSLDQPSIDGVNSYFVSLAAKQGVTVAISGTGSDELFAGYPSFIAMALEQSYQQSGPWRYLARSLIATIAQQRIFNPILRMRGGGRLSAARNKASFITRYAANDPIFAPWVVTKLLSPDLRSRAQTGRSAHRDLNAIDELANGSTIERVTGLCLRGYTNNQLLRDIDAVSMAHSLEVRVPYLDPKIADVSLSLPDNVKMGDPKNLSMSHLRTYRETGSKRILIDIGRPLLPKDFDLQPKRGFGMPFGAWLRGPLKDVMMDALSDSCIRKRGLLDSREVVSIKHKFTEGYLGWTQPWLLMMIELWYREVIDHMHSALSTSTKPEPMEQYDRAKDKK